MDLEQRLNIAKEYENNKEWLQAAKIYEDILSIKDEEEYINKCAWNFSLGKKFNKALTYYESLIDKNPEMAKYHYMKGYQLYSLGKNKEAIVAFLKAIELYPNYFSAHSRIGYVYTLEAGEYNLLSKAEYWKAIGHFKECQKLWNEYNEENRKKNRSEYHKVCSRYGKALCEQKKYNEAIDLFNEALEIKKDINVEYQLAKAYFDIKDFDNARKCLPKSNKFYVKDILAKLKLIEGKYDEAIKIYFSILKYVKKDYLYYNLAEVFINQKKYNKAIDVLKQSIKFRKANHKTHKILADCYYELSNKCQAYKSYKKSNDIKLKHYGFECKECLKNIAKINDEICNQNEDRLIGVVEEFLKNKKSGYIKKNQNNYFFHINDSFSVDVQKGDMVGFKPVKNNKGDKAIEIILVE